MEHIRVIQEVVDEHKDEMPTGVVTRVMAECQKAYEAAPKLYKLTWTVVDSHAHIEYCEDAADFAAVKLSHQTQTLIVEAVNLSDVPSSQRCLTVLPHHGKMFKSWLKLPMPYGKSKDEDPGSMCIIHSIVPYLAPYEPRKRARDAEMAQNEREVRELVGGA